MADKKQSIKDKKEGLIIDKSVIKKDIEGGMNNKEDEAKKKELSLDQFVSKEVSPVEKETKDAEISADKTLERSIEAESQTIKEIEEDSFKKKDLEVEGNLVERKDPYLESIKKEISERENGATLEETDDDTKKQAQEIGEIDDADTQVERLVQLAVKKDSFTAIKIAVHLGQDYVLDKLHDELLKDETQNILREQGILKD